MLQTIYQENNLYKLPVAAKCKPYFGSSRVFYMSFMHYIFNMHSYIFTCSSQNRILVAICNLHGIVSTILTTRGIDNSVCQKEQQFKFSLKRIFSSPKCCLQSSQCSPVPFACELLSQLSMNQEHAGLLPVPRHITYN